jgi:two-component sensor histidine kinase
MFLGTTESDKTHPPGVPARHEGRRSPLAADIAKAVVLALIPLIVFAVAVIVFENRRSRTQMDSTLLDASRRLTEVIEMELQQQLRTLAALAVSMDLDPPPQLAEFHEEARRAAIQHPGWLTITLVDPSSGWQVLNTARPVGVDLPVAASPDEIAEVVRSRRPLISSRLMREEAVIRQPFIVLRVPVVRGEAVIYVLSAALSLTAVQQLMTEQLDHELPGIARPVAGAAIMDADGRFVARLIEPEKAAGQLASEQTRANMRRGPGVYPGRTIDGTETYGAYTRSTLTGWSIVVGIPRAYGDQLGRSSFWFVLAGAAASILLAGIFALLFGREATRRRAEADRLLLLETDARLLQQVKTSLAEKEMLLREIHHRIKNNMQTIISLLRTSARQWPDAYQDVIRTTVRRMAAMVNVHEQLYRSPDLAKLALGPYLESVAREIAIAEGAARRGIDCRVRCDDVEIDLNRAMPLGLIMTECLINAFKHGFPGDRTGSITVELNQAGEAAILSVRDDGVGVPAATSSTRSTLGIDLIEALTRQIGGTTTTRQLSPGTEVIVEFALSVPGSRRKAAPLAAASSAGASAPRTEPREATAPPAGT